MTSIINRAKEYYKSFTLTVIVLGGGVIFILSCEKGTGDNTNGNGDQKPNGTQPVTVRTLNDIFNDFKKDKKALDISDSDLKGADTDDKKAGLIIKKAHLLNKKSLLASGISFKVLNQPFKSKDTFNDINEFETGESGNNGGDKIEYKSDDHKDLVNNLQKAISIVVSRRKEIGKMLHTHAEAKKTSYSDGFNNIDFNSPKTFCKQKYDNFLTAVKTALKDVFKANFVKKFTENGNEFEPLSTGIVLYLKGSKPEDIVKGAKNESVIIEMLENTQKISDKYRSSGSSLATLSTDDLEKLIAKLTEKAKFKDNLFLEMVTHSDALPLFYFSNPLTDSEKKLAGKETLNADNTDSEKYNISDESWKNNPIRLIFEYLKNGYKGTGTDNIGKFTPTQFKNFSEEHVKLMEAVHEAITNATAGPKITSAAIGIGALYLIEQKKALLQGSEINPKPNIADTLKVYTAKMLAATVYTGTKATNGADLILKNCEFKIETGELKVPEDATGGGKCEKIKVNLKKMGIAK